MKKVVVFFLLLFSVSASCRESVTFGAIIFPPNTLLDKETNVCVGEGIDKTRLILSQYDIDMEVICASAIRIYKLIEQGKIDLTINVKSTRALSKSVGFTDTPYQLLKLNLYRHTADPKGKTIAAIRGFDYHGNRQRLEHEGYRFVDLPNSLSAIELFVRGRSSHLISYKGPVDYYTKELSLPLNEDVVEQRILEVPAYYAITSDSAVSDLLSEIFRQVAARQELSYFNDIETGKP